MTDKLTKSRRLNLLSNRRCRTIITVLQERGGPVSVDDLVDLISRRVYGEPSDADRRTVHVELHHNHLPKLEAADVLAYDVDDRLVRPRANVDRLARPVQRPNDGPSRPADA